MPPPRPKIPAEYANVAKKISSELPPSNGADFDSFLDDLAGKLSGNLEERSADLPNETTEWVGSNPAGKLTSVKKNTLDPVKAAGVFAKTEGAKTPDVNNPADFEVSMDQLLQGFKEPKAVEGTGIQKYVEVDNRSLVDESTGVITPKLFDNDNGYTPNKLANAPQTYLPISLNDKGKTISDKAGESVERNVRSHTARFNNEQQTQNIHERNLANFDKSPELDEQLYGEYENIPAAVGGLVGAGVLLSSQNAEAKEPSLEQELQLDTTGTNPDAKSGLNLLKDKYTSKGASATAPNRTSVIMDEVKSLGDALLNRAKGNLSTFAKDVGQHYTQYHAETDALEMRAQEMFNNMEANGQFISEEDKAMLVMDLKLKAGSPIVSALAELESVNTEVSKFNQETLQPLIKSVQAYKRMETQPVRELLQKHAPSIAVIGDTALYPMVGTTGWGLPLNTINNTNTEEETEAKLATLAPEARKLLNDKSALLGTDGGKALLVLANGYAELPMWIIGGSSKIGLMVGGIANELIVDNPEDSDLARGAGLGLAGGKIMESILAPVVKGGLSLLGKVKLDPSIATDMFGKVTFDDNATHMKKVFEAFANKNVVEPLMMMTGKTANKLADDASLKVRPDVSEAMNTQVVAPQALVLGIDPATGKPKLYGVKDGLYGELNDFVNPEGRPVLMSQMAKDEFPGNQELIETWNKLIDPKRKTPATRAHGIDEWTPDVIPPENPALVFAWKNMVEGKGGMVEVYRAGSRDFNKDLLKSRALTMVQYDGPNGHLETGIGFWGGAGDVVFAPDAAEGIPGAIPYDLTFRQTRINPNVDPTRYTNDRLAWEVNQLDDNAIYRIVDDMKARQSLQRDAAAEAARGGTLSDGTLPPDKMPRAPFDNLPDEPGSVIPNKSTEVNFSFLPFSLQGIAKAIQKTSHTMNNALGKAKLIGDTMYGEKFKIDASIQAFSLRHYKRLTEDLNKQLVASFRDAAATPLERQQFNDQLRAFIEAKPINYPNTPNNAIGKRGVVQPVLPPQLNHDIQLKVQKFVAERNYEYALIEQLGGSIPDTAPGGNAELERLFALDYFEAKDGEINPWLQRMRKQQHVSSSLINLLGNKNATKATKSMGHYDQVMGRMSTEMEMATDYMNRKLQINQLGFMKELADNMQASSPVANQVLGHTKQVDFNGSGLLKGKWISEETYKAISTYPQDQKMLQNTMLGIVNMIKFNKTVLNPTTWVKNIMGNVWGVMNSNIVSSWNMAYRMPKGIRQMSKDLAKFNADVMANDASVHRVHETLKYGLLGAEFESSRTKMLDVLDNLAEPIAQTSNLTWGEKLADKYFRLKDNTLGGLAHTYSKVDMATKYSLYVNGLERWGIDLATNKIRGGAQGRRMAADLLGASAVNFAVPDDVITDMIKREIVRRIHLSLPMVDRIGPIPTALNKLSPITNPWLRTASELTRITLQMPHRMITEKGYLVNSLKTASFLGTILGVNKALRLTEGISDKTVDDAKMIAPSNIKNYMPGATATRFKAGTGAERGIVFLDFANGLVEPAQWFKGGEVNNGVDVAKRVGANGIDLVMGGGLLADESRDAQAALGLIDGPQNFNVPFWKQNDTVRYATSKAVQAGPAIFNNAWQLYANENMPNSKGVGGKDKLEQPLSMLALKAIGIPVATMGSEKQQEYKVKELNGRINDLVKKKAFAGLQREGSSTGAFQKPYNAEEVKAKIEAEIVRLRAEKEKIENATPIGKSGSSKLNLTKLRTPHL